MKNIISHDYTGEKETFVPLIGFKVVRVENASTNGDLGEATVLTLVNEHHVAIDITVSDAPCMIVFCSFEQMSTLINAAKKHGFNNYIPLVFVKNYSPQVLKANMRVVGATEYALVLYRDKLPKFRNGAKFDENGKTIRGTGHMVFNWFKWEKDGKEIPKIHPAQKPVKVLEQLIQIFTDPGDVVIDPCCGSGSTLRAARNLGRSAYGFEIDRNFYSKAKNEMLNVEVDPQMSITDFIGGTQ